MDFNHSKKYYDQKGTYVIKKIFTKHESIPKRHRRNSNPTISNDNDVNIFKENVPNFLRLKTIVNLEYFLKFISSVVILTSQDWNSYDVVLEHAYNRKQNDVVQKNNIFLFQNDIEHLFRSEVILKKSIYNFFVRHFLNYNVVVFT